MKYLVIGSQDFVEIINHQATKETIILDKQDQAIINECLEKLSAGGDKFLVMCTVIGIASRFECDGLLVNSDFLSIKDLLTSKTSYDVLDYP